MRFEPTKLAGVYAVELEPHADERGFFARALSVDEFQAHGLDGRVSQISLSRNVSAGVLRGMHLQRPPHEETKLVRCVRGAVYDVVVDLRRGSPTHGEWVAIELDERSGRAAYVPQGCAHGFQTLEPDSDVLYVISVPHAPDFASGVRWDDPAFGIEWPYLPSRLISERDRSWPDYDPSVWP
jgi:dTDP-4-dehydrorhamnose 3,5-epimerase